MARLPYVVPYDPAFLGDEFSVPMPTPKCSGGIFGGGEPIDYIHASLIMHRDRKTAIVAAHNIDVATKVVVDVNDNWSNDDRVGAFQTGKAAYQNNPWDRGHLARRAALAWGETKQEAQDASDASFFYPNASLQHEKFNRDEWAGLEDWVLDVAGAVSKRLCVFTGPIFTTVDQMTGPYRVPSAFFKVVVIREDTTSSADLVALGFVMKQNQFLEDWNGASIIDYATYQVGIKEIGGYAGLDFGVLAQLDDFVWRRPRFRERRASPPVRVAGPSDLDLAGTRKRRARGLRAVPKRKALLLPKKEVPIDKGLEDCGCTPLEAVGPDRRLDMLVRKVEGMQILLDRLLAKMPDDGPERLAPELHRQIVRVIGGQTAPSDLFPECACLGFEGEWSCSGVLLAPRIVLTAAHCAPNIDKVLLKSVSVLAPSLGETVDVVDVIVHPDYDGDLLPSHDIAILRLAEDAATPPPELATTAQISKASVLGVVGYGYNHPTESIGFGTKRFAHVEMLPTNALAPGDLAQLEAEHGFKSDFEFFAGRKGLGVDTCNGDSGGPAYILDNDVWLLAGLTSRAAFSSTDPCGDGGIYTRIEPYLPWIQSVTGELPGVAPMDAAPSAKVVIHRLMPNPPGTDKGNEWVELTSVDTVDVDLARCELQDRQGGVEPLSGPISPGQTRRFVLPADSKIKLANTGDDVRLLCDGLEIDSVTYEAAGSGEVIEFDLPPPEVDPILPHADPC